MLGMSTDSLVLAHEEKCASMCSRLSSSNKVHAAHSAHGNGQRTTDKTTKRHHPAPVTTPAETGRHIIARSRSARTAMGAVGVEEETMDVTSPLLQIGIPPQSRTFLLSLGLRQTRLIADRFLL